MAFQVEKTRITPFILIDQGEITIKGRSIPENSFAFFEPVINACKEYVMNPAKHTMVNIHLEYVNSGSKKYLTNIFTILEKSYLKGNVYEIIWTHDSDDEAMLELGDDFKGIIKIPIFIKQSE